MSKEIIGLAKFGEKKYMEELLKGTLFLNTVNSFKKIENDYRGDVNEGLSDLIQPEYAALQFQLPPSLGGDFIHLNKTAAMIVGCMRAGAIIGDASEDDLEKITKYAENIGLSFQIVDDILDIIGDEEKLGKPIGSDIENHKSTYPSLLGLDKSRQIARELIEEGKSSIKDLPSEREFLNQLGDYIISRDC